MIATRYATIAVAVLTIAGCSAAAARPDVPTTHTTAHAASPTATTHTPAATTARALAQAAHCTDITTADKIIARTSVTCTLAGQLVEVATFNDNASRDSYLRMGRSVEPGAAARVGNGWLAASLTATDGELAPFGGTPTK